MSHKMRKPKKKPYLTSAQLAEALEESQRIGRPTEQACNFFRMIAAHLLGDSRYRNYNAQMHEDMESAALLKCIKNIKNYKKEYADKCFNYFTRITEHAFWECLGKYYKQMNLQRELMRQYADMLECTNPIEANQLRDSLLKNDTTNTICKG